MDTNFLTFFIIAGGLVILMAISFVADHYNTKNDPNSRFWTFRS